MPSFSELHQLGLTQPELDFVDVDPATDTPLFIDPYAISKRPDAWSARCHNSIISFFQAVVDSIRSGDVATAQRLLGGLGEPNDTCLGYSTESPNGRGVGEKQSVDLYKALSDSRAVKTGLLSELSDCELMIPHIGWDKISDITTNIIRGHLIDYTQDQCHLHRIRVRGRVASGRIWNADTVSWTARYAELPVVHGRRLLLVPKATVGWTMAIDHQKYYRHFVLNFLQSEHLDANSALVQTLKNGTRRVTKKSLEARYPCSKEFLLDFSRRHPEVLRAYKEAAARAGREVLEGFGETVNEAVLAEGLIERLHRIRPGNDHASEFHDLMVGLLEFLFYPDLIYPVKEHEVNQGRKRIDITYTNNAQGGFFYRVHTAHRITCNFVMVECKNYSRDPANPELDQIAGRFSPNRGRLGLLIGRGFTDRDLFLERCRDTAQDDRGFVIPLGDTDIEQMLTFVAEGRRERVDTYLEDIFRRICS